MRKRGSVDVKVAAANDGSGGGTETSSLLCALRRQRGLATASAAWLFLFLSGCYTYRSSVGGAIAPGTQVSMTITDQGRVGLGDRLGRGVLRVDGRVMDSADSAWVVRVAAVELLTGGKSHWSGEEVQLPRSYVSEVSTREFSRSKTWLAVGLTVGALVVAIGTASLIASGIEGTDTKPPPDGQTTRSGAQARSAAQP